MVTFASPHADDRWITHLRLSSFFPRPVSEAGVPSRGLSIPERPSSQLFLQKLRGPAYVCFENFVHKRKAVLGFLEEVPEGPSLALRERCFTPKNFVETTSAAEPVQRLPRGSGNKQRWRGVSISNRTHVPYPLLRILPILLNSLLNPPATNDQCVGLLSSPTD